MAETIALALEGRYENYSLGKDLTVAQGKEIADIARRNGFRLAGFRSFEPAIPRAVIERIPLKAGLRGRSLLQSKFFIYREVTYE